MFNMPFREKGFGTNFFNSNVKFPSMNHENPAILQDTPFRFNVKNFLRNFMEKIKDKKKFSTKFLVDFYGIF